jgi:ceramide glucosyltransferase
MTPAILLCTTFCIVTTAFHLASIFAAIVRLRPSARRKPLPRHFPPITLVRPLCGLDNHAADTLRSTFALDDPRTEVLFCVASAKDPAVAVIEALMAEHPDVRARLLVGDERISSNPKLNNMVKGYRAAAHDWIVFTDSNVLMPSDYIQRLFMAWRADTGLVASPPVGCRPQGFWAKLECAFLNTHQARWQYFAEACGHGFAQGKTMMWRRADLDRAGGIRALAAEPAEDAATTKLVRAAGLKVHLVDAPFEQPLGRRSAAEVWNRQARWTRLRRASFISYFAPEIFSGAVLPFLAAAYVVTASGLPLLASVGAMALVWYGSEMLLAAVAGWYLPALYPLHAFTRDLLLPVLWINAWRGDGFVWRGHEMQVEKSSRAT